jgi:release factor glutamine methyltransferase
VHGPRSDTRLLGEALLGERLRGASVADLCTGTGVLALAAASAGAARVVAVDISARAMLTARLNAVLNRLEVDVRRGDLIAALGRERFDVIVSNPPYVPAATDKLPRHTARTALDGGRDGRALIDRVCREAPARLRPGGSLLLVHSSICGIERTCAMLDASGLRVEVVSRSRGPLGPILRSRAAMLRERGLLGELDEEELAVFRASSPAATSPQRPAAVSLGLHDETTAAPRPGSRSRAGAPPRCAPR